MARPAEIEPFSLEYARQAALALLAAEENYIAAIVAAHESGNSCHQIAKALGINHQTVSKIIVDRTRLSLSDHRSQVLRRIHQKENA